MADIYNSNWRENDSANTDAAPNGMPEGMQSSGVNNWGRATMGALKRYVNQQSPVTTTGTSTAFVLAYSVPPGALYDGSTHTVLFHAANDAGATLNVGAIGDRPLHYYSAGAWRALPAGLLGVDQTGRVAYHAASSAYRLLDLPDRTGEVVTFAGGTAPAGSLLCYGQAVSRTAYAGLFAALGTAYGVGDGTSTFNLPDLRGRAAAGKGDMGGTESGRLNGQIASTLGAAGGEQSQTYSLTSGSFSGSGSITGTAYTNGLGTTGITTGPFNAAGAGGSGGDVADQLHQHTVSGNAVVGGTCAVSGSLSGSTDARSNVQPTMVLNYLIRV